MANPRGTTLTRLRQTQQTAQQHGGEAPACANVLAPAALRPPKSERSILVVESDPDLQVQTARALRGPNLRVVAAGSAGGAIALLEAWEVDLVLVSESLPGRSGVDLVRDIRLIRPHCPVLIMTSQPPSKLAAAAAHMAGAAGCIATPQSVESLAAWFMQEPEKRFPVRAERGRSHLPSAGTPTNSVPPAREAVAE